MGLSFLLCAGVSKLASAKGWASGQRNDAFYQKGA